MLRSPYIRINFFLLTKIHFAYCAKIVLISDQHYATHVASSELIGQGISRRNCSLSLDAPVGCLGLILDGSVEAAMPPDRRDYVELMEISTIKIDGAPKLKLCLLTPHFVSSRP